MYKYEFIKQELDLPVKGIIESVDSFQFHIHNVLELIVVLKGSVVITREGEDYLLKKDDFLLINPNELHGVRATEEENIVLSFLIGLNFYKWYFSDISDIVFNCNSLENVEENNDKYDYIRYSIANIIFELNSTTKESRLRVAGLIYDLSAYILENFEYKYLDESIEENRDKDILRISRIVNYISEDIKNISLKEIAEKEHISYSYLSHFIKESLGMSFQEFLNLKRINEAVRLLVTTDKTITAIANESGFSSQRSFNKIFKENYEMTPTEYRKEAYKKLDSSKVDIKMDQIISTEEDIGGPFLEVRNKKGYKELFSYLDLSEDKQPLRKFTGTKKIDLKIDMDCPTVKISHAWRELLTFGRARDGLNKEFQRQLKGLQRDIGFKYIKFHGIFAKDMLRIDRDENNRLIYNWTFVDNLLDFLVGINLKPFINLSFMPEEFKSSDQTVFWWGANISPPKDIKLWTNLINRFIVHLINRYGMEEVKTWKFEFWNEPDLKDFFWAGDQEEFFEFFKATFLAIKDISEDLQIGGPAVTYEVTGENKWLEDFLDYCLKEEIELDFLTMHIYPKTFISKDELVTSLEKSKSEEIVLDELLEEFNKGGFYYDRMYFHNALKNLNSLVEFKLGRKIDIHITEWNASYFNRNLIHDTCFIPNYIIDSVSKSRGLAKSLGYWNLTDLSEEHRVGITEFSGSPGLITRNGIEKPSYFAYCFLNELGEELILKEDDYIVTKTGENLQILLYNYAEFNKMYLKGDREHLRHKHRYLVYQTKVPNEFLINISGLKGKYHIKEYVLNRENGSAFDNWIEMGGNTYLDKEDISYLKAISKPSLRSYKEFIDSSSVENIKVPVHGVHLITFNKIIE